MSSSPSLFLDREKKKFCQYLDLDGFFNIYKKYIYLLPNLSFLNITYPVITNSASDISVVAQDSVMLIM